MTDQKLEGLPKIQERWKMTDKKQEDDDVVRWRAVAWKYHDEISLIDRPFDTTDPNVVEVINTMIDRAVKSVRVRHEEKLCEFMSAIKDGGSINLISKDEIYSIYKRVFGEGEKK